MTSSEEIINKLGLIKHPKEGGYFTETYRSEEELSKNVLPQRYKSKRSLSTAIYYMITPDTISPMHRLITDEIFHFYLGDPVNILMLNPDNTSEIITLGHDILNNQIVQMVVKRNTWFGFKLNSGGSFALLGSTMSPGFDYSDYEEGDPKTLSEQYPQHKDFIYQLSLKK